VYFKCKKRIPNLCTDLYGNKLLIEKIERAALALSERCRFAGEELYVRAIHEAEVQLANPRSDSAEALDR